MMLVTAILDMALTAAPWLLLGLFVAGLVKALVPEHLLQRWVGGDGVGGVAQAAVAGAPLPLCSCGAIPTAVTLHRGGAGRGPTTAFLIGAPGVGVDSVALTYALLGPFMMVARVVGAMATAMATGWLVASLRTRAGVVSSASGDVAGEGSGDDCCAGNSDCCGVTDGANGTAAPDRIARLRYGLGYAFGDLYDEIIPWMAAGLVLAGGLGVLVEPATLAEIGTGPLAIIVMGVIGIPLYVCATAATPAAVGLIAAGVSPGAVITFLVAGPVTSLATLGVLRREMGNQVLVRYLAGIFGSAVLLGLTVDYVVATAGIDVIHQLGSGGALLPYWLKMAALVLLVGIAIRPLRRFAGRWTGLSALPSKA